VSLACAIMFCSFRNFEDIHSTVLQTFRCSYNGIDLRKTSPSGSLQYSSTVILLILSKVNWMILRADRSCTPLLIDPAFWGNGWFGNSLIFFIIIIVK
jgi:hypothetical protein